MHAIQCRYYPNRVYRDGSKFHAEILKPLLTNMFWNGQLLSDSWYPIQGPRTLTLYVLTPAADSLEVRHSNPTIRSLFKSLLRRSTHPPRYRHLGRIVDHPDPCRCKSPSHYILYTSGLLVTPPVRCGDCIDPVPLYTLPSSADDHGYNDILQWQDEFLQSDGQAGELDSDVTEAGREICKGMAAKTGKPFYYVLRHASKTCPGCRHPWKKGEHAFEARCDRCFLLSTK